MAERKYSVAGAGVVQVDIEIKDGTNLLKHAYKIPGTLVDGEPVGGGAFLDWLKGTSVVGKAPNTKTVPNVEIAYDRFLYATDLKERASQREEVAAVSTVIMVNGKPVDIMGFPMPKAIAAVNAAVGLSAITGKDVQNAFMVAQRKLVEAGAVLNKESGMLTAKK